MVSVAKQVPEKASRAVMQRLAFAPGPFPEVVGAKRQYPGAVEGGYLASYRNELSARGQKAFADLISPLVKLEQGLKGGPKQPHTDILGTYDKITQRIDRKGSARISKDGLVIPPVTNEGKAALAVLLLYHKARLTRVRQCLQCGAWFFAHLERQRFCNDPRKRCQWRYFHSPEWRKKNREERRKKNREHQRKYRERLFGKRR